jgi:hypothetical protein
MKHESALAIGLNAVAQMPPADFAGTWINELKSRMELMVSDDQVVGRYTSAVSGSIGPLARLYRRHDQRARHRL